MLKRAYVAGGCFWGMEELFRQQRGIVAINAGYCGGSNDNPTYENHPGHAETLEIIYDDKLTSYEQVLDYFFRIHDPTTLNRQGNDIGSSYRSAIFFSNKKEKNIAQDFISLVNRSRRWPKPVVTSLEAFNKFYMAEEYHQDYLQKNPGGYTCHFERFDSFLGKNK